MVTLILPISVVICVKDLNDWVTSEFFFRDYADKYCTVIFRWCGCPHQRKGLKDEESLSAFSSKVLPVAVDPGLE